MTTQRIANVRAWLKQETDDADSNYQFMWPYRLLDTMLDIAEDEGSFTSLSILEALEKCMEER